MTGIEFDEHGMPPGQDCPTCGAPLVPDVLDADGHLGIVWLCPTHALVSATVDPFGA